MVAKKRKSKRQTLQQKYKIVKRTKQHRKKVAKGAIKRTGKAKIIDKRIPNSWPFKEELLKEVQAAKSRAEESKLQQKEKRSETMVRFNFQFEISCLLSIKINRRLNVVQR